MVPDNLTNTLSCGIPFLTGKNGPRLYSEETRSSETRTTETQPASQLAEPQFVEELKQQINGYRQRAGRWMDGC